jgi:hypothetical protein
LIRRTASSLNSRVNFRLSMTHLQLHHDRHVTLCDGLPARLSAISDRDENFAPTYKMLCAQTSIVMRLATSLRLTPRSNREPRDAREERGQQPWQRD